MDPATIELILGVINGIVKAAPTIEAGIEGIKPYAVMLYDTLILGKDVTEEQLADLQAKRHELSKHLQDLEED